MNSRSHNVLRWWTLIRPRRLELYLLRQIVIGIAVIAPIVVGMYLVILLPELSAESLRSWESFAEFVWKFLLRIPTIIDANFPFIAMLGAMLGLGRLVENNEINAIRFAGVSVYRISVVMLMLALLLAGTAFAFKEFVVTEADAILRLHSKSSNRIAGGGNYHWLRASGDLVGFAITDQQTDYYRDLMVLRLKNDGQVSEVLRAKEARFIADHPAREKWQLTEVHLDNFIDNTTEYHPILWREQIFSIKGSNWLGYRANELRWKNLNNFACSRDMPSALDLKSYCLEFWQRNANPLLLVALLLLATTFIYGLGRFYPTSARMMGGLMLSAACIGLGNSMPYLADSIALPYYILVMSPAVFLMILAIGRVVIIARR